MIPEEIARLAETVAGVFEGRPCEIPPLTVRDSLTGVLSPDGYWICGPVCENGKKWVQRFRLDGFDPDADAIITGRMLDWFHMERHELYLRSWGGIGGDLLWCVEWYCDSYPECIGKPIHSRVLAVAKAFVAVFGGGK